jgi:hypothetical protein
MRWLQLQWNVKRDVGACTDCDQSELCKRGGGACADCNYSECENGRVMHALTLDCNRSDCSEY